MILTASGCSAELETRDLQSFIQLFADSPMSTFLRAFLLHFGHTPDTDDSYSDKDSILDNSDDVIDRLLV